MTGKFRYAALAACMTTALLLMTGCGCGKKNTDPETQEVLKISITPEPTPTEAPQEANPNAVVTKDGITMINGYTKDGTAAVTADAASTESDSVSEEALEMQETDEE